MVVLRLFLRGNRNMIWLRLRDRILGVQSEWVIKWDIRRGSYTGQSPIVYTTNPGCSSTLIFTLLVESECHSRARPLLIMCGRGTLLYQCPEEPEEPSQQKQRELLSCHQRNDGTHTKRTLKVLGSKPSKFSIRGHPWCSGSLLWKAWSICMFFVKPLLS